MALLAEPRRHSDDNFAAYWPEQTTETQAIADALNATPKVVFSSTLESAPWGSWEPARLVAGSAAEEVPRLKAEPGKDMVVWGCLTLSDSLMREGLADEFRLQVCPVVLGRGKRLFEDGLATQRLTHLETNTYDGRAPVRPCSGRDVCAWRCQGHPRLHRRRRRRARPRHRDVAEVVLELESWRWSGNGQDVAARPDNDP